MFLTKHPLSSFTSAAYGSLGSSPVPSLGGECRSSTRPRLTLVNRGLFFVEERQPTPAASLSTGGRIPRAPYVAHFVRSVGAPTRPLPSARNRQSRFLCLRTAADAFGIVIHWGKFPPNPLGRALRSLLKSFEITVLAALPQSVVFLVFLSVSNSCSRNLLNNITPVHRKRFIVDKCSDFASSSIENV